MAMLFQCLIVVMFITIERTFPVESSIMSQIIEERNRVIDILNRSKMIEFNLAEENSIKEDSRTFETMLGSWADNEALNIAKEAYILARTTLQLTYKQCQTFGEDYKKCFDDLAKIPSGVSTTNKCKINAFRSADGSCNNHHNLNWGMTYGAYSRIMPAHYLDNIWFEFSKKDNYNQPDFIDPLKLSEILYKDLQPSKWPITVAAVAWSNLVANDMSHTAAYRAFFTKQNINCCNEHKFRVAPRHRHQFCLYMNKPDDVCVSYVRSMLAIPDKHQFGPAQQMNTASSFLDGSTIYGSTAQIEASMRANVGGQLKVIPNNEVIDREINCVLDKKCFFTADLRSILNPASATIHTMLVREHNRIAKALQKINPKWTNNKLFSETKRIVVAEIQHITYNEWLPRVIGMDMIEKTPHLKIPMKGYSSVYNEKVNPSVSNEFANAAMKFITPLNLAYLNSQNPYQINTKNNLKYGPIDVHTFQRVVEDMGKTLISTYSSKGAKSFTYNVIEDIETLSLDIQRGRDHGFPPYIEYSKESASIPVHFLKQIKQMNKTLNSIDLIVGGLVEIPTDGALVGKTFTKIIAKQMEATRLGDTFFYDNKHQMYPFTLSQINEIKKVKLAHLLCHNFPLLKEVQMSALLEANATSNARVKCSNETEIKHINLKLWK